MLGCLCYCDCHLQGVCKKSLYAFFPLAIFWPMKFLGQRSFGSCQLTTDQQFAEAIFCEKYPSNYYKAIFHLL